MSKNNQHPGRILIRCLNTSASCGSILSYLWMSKLLPLSLRLSPVNLQRKLISATFTHDLILSVSTQSSLTSKLNALPFDSAQSWHSHYCWQCTKPPVLTLRFPSLLRKNLRYLNYLTWARSCNQKGQATIFWQKWLQIILCLSFTCLQNNCVC